jgi:hypothetical protein
VRASVHATSATARGAKWMTTDMAEPAEPADV